MPPHWRSSGTWRATGSVETSQPASGATPGAAAAGRAPRAGVAGSPLGLRGGLGKTLLTAFLLLAIVPLGLLALATYNQIQSDMRHKVLTSLDAIVALEEAHVVDWVEGCERELGLLAGLCGGVPVAGETCVANAAAWLTETQAAGLMLVETGTEVVQAIAWDREALGEGSLTIPSAAALRDGITAGGLVTLSASDTGDRPLLAIGYVLPEGERYLVALFPWQSLQRLIGTPSYRPPEAGGTLSGRGTGEQPDVMTRVSLATRDEESGFWIYDSGEAALGQGPGQRVEIALSEGEATDEDVRQEAAGGIEQALSGRSGTGLYTNLAGVPVLGAFRWNPQLQVAIAAEQSQAEALAAGNTMTAVIVAITLGMALVTASIAAVVTRRVTRPIVQLTETAARMARGDLDQQVVVTRQDEIGVLARAFNRMAAELRVLYADLNTKVEFLTNMSHALRTPLTSIIGFSRLMLKELDGPLTELQRADLAAIHEGGQQLLELINDMLELSDLELEMAPVVVDEVDLTEMVDGVMATARALALNKPVELVDEVADNLPTLYTDGRRVRRVLLALVSNAIRITDEGSIRLSATASDGLVTIGIRAIGAKGQVKIFDQSLGNGDLSPEGDLGQSRPLGPGPSSPGLTISRQMVEELGGRIQVESNGGAGELVGSAFVFVLPISPSDAT